MFCSIIELCQNMPDGITDTVIQNEMPQCTPQQRVTAINRLLSTVSMDMLFENTDTWD